MNRYVQQNQGSARLMQGGYCPFATGRIQIECPTVANVWAGDTVLSAIHMVDRFGASKGAP